MNALRSPGGPVATAAVLAVATTRAVPVTVAGTLTADNHYGLYVGNNDAGNLAYVGRNEVNDLGFPCQWNWSCAESFSFSSETTTDYIYVVAWDDGGPQSWIGHFSFGSTTLVSNKASWEYLIPASTAGFNTGGAPPVDLSTLNALINPSSVWSAPLVDAANGTSPWGTIAGLDPNARFLWHDTLSDGSSSDGKYVVFRTTLAVPEPSALALVGLALAAAGLARRRG